MGAEKEMLEAKRLAARADNVMTKEDRDYLDGLQLETLSNEKLKIVCKEMLKIFKEPAKSYKCLKLDQSDNWRVGWDFGIHKWNLQETVNPWLRRTKQQRIVVITKAWSMYLKCATEPKQSGQAGSKSSI